MPSRKYPKAEPVSTEALADKALDEMEDVFIRTGNEQVRLYTLVEIQTEVNCILLEQLITSPGTRALISPKTITQIEQYLEACK